MTGDTPREGWGGARPGAGRPRTRVVLVMPPEVIEQLEEIARWHGASVLDCVREALLSFISDEQDRRDAHVPPEP